MSKHQDAKTIQQTGQPLSEDQLTELIQKIVNRTIVNRTNELANGDETFLPAPAVRRRYNNITGMTLFRWQRDPSTGFPQPIVIGKLKYWRLSELVAFEQSCAAKSATYRGAASKEPPRRKSRGGDGGSR